MVLRSPCAAPVLLGLLIATQGAAGQDASEIFAAYSNDVVKVEVLEARSLTPRSVGTAFYAEGRILVTNFHVIRSLLYSPDNYTLRLVPNDGAPLTEVGIIRVDPANDLALLRVEEAHPPSLFLSEGAPANGEALFSLGHPADLQTSVVEGVYNGRVEFTVAPLMHFSGSINPGMSGGPTVRRDGGVVGINVSTAGNQLSFLIPAEKALALLEGADEIRSDVPVDDLLDQVSASLTGYQDRLHQTLLGDSLPTTVIGGVIVPSAPDSGVDCSANPHSVEDDRYEVVEYRCSAEDQVLVGETGSDMLFGLEHLYLARGELSRLQFSSLVNQWYQDVYEWEVPENDDATELECRRNNVETPAGVELEIVLCAREHKHHSGLYDLFVRSAMLGSPQESVVSTLRASPISFENLESLTARWLRGFSWRP